MNLEFKNFLLTPFKDVKNFSLAKDKFDNQKLIFLGGSGAICQSFALAIKALNIRPKEIILISKNPCNDVFFQKCFPGKVKHLSVDLSQINCLNGMTNYFFNSFVFFFAGYGQPNLFKNNPENIININVNVLLSLRVLPIRELYYASTSEIYTGSNDMNTEDCILYSHPQHSRGLYIESKRLSEAIIHHLLNNEFRCVAFRIALSFPTTFQTEDTRVLSHLIKSGLTGEVTLNGGSNLLRQYQYGPHSTLKMLFIGVDSYSLLYNVAGGYIFTLGELAIKLSKYFSSKLKINDVNYDTSSPLKVLISTTRFDTEYNFNESLMPSFEDCLDYHLSKKNIFN